MVEPLSDAGDREWRDYEGMVGEGWLVRGMWGKMKMRETS